MKAWQYSKTAGGLEKNLTLQNAVPVPRLPTNPSTTQLLIQVLSTSINPVDYKAPETGFLSRIVFGSPATPGTDFCGRVVRTAGPADERAGFDVGDLVFGRTGFQQHGTTGEYTTTPAKNVARLPDGVSPDDAAAVGVAGFTAYQSIVPHVKAGDKVFINGGSGGTGTFGIQIAKLLGCHVTVSCSPGKADLCRSLGADELIDYNSTDVSAALKAKGQVFTLVVDNVGSPASLYKAANDFLQPTGRFVQVGAGLDAHSVKTITPRLLRPAFLGGGKRKYELFVMRPNREDLKQLGTWIADKKIRVVIGETYEFGDVPKAFEKLKTGQTMGKLVIHVGK
ncbi:hypothetical protein B0J18DRAFT_447410 [Chaetomium sp. MPI-SDFR-AT-0129]|nr:hypothetical protein B0J18DRAFT_447410 [Chaetomium sp. MPI-SDFR-AT-0129]